MSGQNLNLENISLEISGLVIERDGRRVVGPLDLTLSSGRFIALAGPNGAGKSSLMLAIAGLLPHQGQIRLKGVDGAGPGLETGPEPGACLDLGACSGRERARHVAYLPQGGNAAWPVSARQIVALGRLAHGRSLERQTSEDRAAIEQAMRDTDTLSFADVPVNHLSGGERARVFLARVLAVNAPLMLVDEPTANLDPRHRLMVLQSLRERAQRGAIIIAVLHDLAEAASFADELVVLDKGLLAAHAAPRDALDETILRDVFGVRLGENGFLGPRWHIDG
jgi:iron complex transport system ATP-binding protein